MRLLFVTTSLAHGGAERHSITLMNRLAERGHACHAVYVKNEASQRDRIHIGTDNTDSTGGTVHCLEARRFFDLQALRRMVRLIESLRPSAIVTANPYALMYASLALWWTHWQAPVVVTYHSTRLLGLREWVKMMIDRFFIHRADCLVFVSNKQCEYWQRRGVTAQETQVIHNGIDLSQFHPDRHTAVGRTRRGELGFADDDFVIGMVAVMRPEKNHIQLLAAVAQLRRRGIPARALLIGDGPMRAAIEATAQALGISHLLHVTGYLEDVRPLVAACDAVVLCSITEALSLAAIEAMAMGKPVVHSDVGGGAELVLPGYNGYLFPVGDTAALVNRLALLFDREHAALLGRNARDVVETIFSETAMVARYENLLGDLCEHQTLTRAPVPAAATPEMRRDLPPQWSAVQLDSEARR